MVVNIPVKTAIINTDDQVQLRNLSNGNYATGNCTPTSGGFILRGFLNNVAGSQLQLLSPATRIQKTTFSPGVKELNIYQFALSGTAKKGDLFILRMFSLNDSPVEFQNYSITKHFQLSKDAGTVNQLVADLAQLINADPYSPVIAIPGFNNASPAVDDRNKLALVAKETGRNFFFELSSYVDGGTGRSISITKLTYGSQMYSNEDVLETAVQAALPVNTYDYLKNLHWSLNVEVDRNIEWFPRKGTNYVSYYFEVSKDVSPSGGYLPGSPASIRTGYKIWVADGLSLATAMDLLMADVNV